MYSRFLFAVALAALTLTAQESTKRLRRTAKGDHKRDLAPSAPPGSPGASTPATAPAANRSWCPARCAQSNATRSLIVLDNFKKAGLADRQIVLENLGQIAVELCARLSVPRPCRALPNRNSLFGHGYDVDCGLDWNDLYRFVDAFEKPMIVDEVAKRGGGGVRVLRSHGEHDVAATLTEAVRLRDAGVVFVWHLEGWFYSWDGALEDAASKLGFRPARRDACAGCEDVVADRWQRTYLSTAPLAPPPCVLGVAPRIAALAGEVARHLGSFSALHVRRGDANQGDAMHRCGSDLERDVRPFLECVAPLGQEKLLVFTDERNPTYRRALLQLIERGGRAAADGDALVAEVLKENPSPYDTTGHGYLVGRELQGLAKVRFELHRELCRVTVLGPWVGALAPSARRAAVGLARECHKP